MTEHQHEWVKLARLPQLGPGGLARAAMPGVPYRDFEEGMMGCTFRRLIYLCDPCTVALYEARAEWLRERGVS